MTLFVPVVLIAIAGILAVFRRQRTGGALFGTALALFLAVGCGPVPAWLLDRLQAPYLAKPAVQWGKSNIIVLLGAGTERLAQTQTIEPGMFSYPRLVEAARLYGDCHKVSAACRILVSGGDAERHGAPEATVYRDALTGIGVPAADILVEARSMNTWQNARFTSDMLKTSGADRVLLVSSGIHLRRSLVYFAHFGIAPTPARADYLTVRISLLPRSYNFLAADSVMHEYIGLARYHVYNALGWNEASALPSRTQ